MKKFFAFGLLLAATAVMSSCKEDKVPDPEPPTDPELRIVVQPQFGTEMLYLDSTYMTAEGYNVQFTDLKFYLGSPRWNGITLIDAGLFDYRERGNLLLKTNGKTSDFPSLQAYLGIEEATNHLDPSAFDNGSMLNIANANDMHWGWGMGYIFMKVEARVDTIQDGNALFDHPVVFHIGMDENVQTLNLSDLNWSEIGGFQQASLKLDMQKFLQNGASTIDLKTEYSSHSAAGQEVLSAKVITNFVASISPL
jgi:hypothetical protein